MKMNRNKMIVITIRTLICGILIILFVKGLVMPYLEDQRESNFGSMEIKKKRSAGAAEYIQLFNPPARDSIVKLWNFVTKSKFPYIRYTYKINYSIVVYKMKMKNPIPINEFIHLENNSDGMSGFTNYIGYTDVRKMDFRYSTKYDSIVTDCFLSYSHKILNKITLGDTIVNYDLMANMISFKYEADGFRDIVLIKDKNSLTEVSPVNMNVTFYKKGPYVYLVIIYPREDKLKITNEILEELFGWEL
jgi:hypothetical protein